MSLTLMTHNVYWLQGMPFSSKNPGPPRENIVNGLLKIYRSIAPDILCLQEIQSLAAATRIWEGLNVSGHYIPGQKLQQYGGTIAGQVTEIAGQADASVERFWLKTRLTFNGWKGILCNIHLPSGDEKEEIRIQELQQMLDAPPRPDFVVGDFNELPSDGLHAFMERSGYLDAAQLLHAGDRSTVVEDENRRIDYIWVSALLRERVTSYRLIDAHELNLGEGRYLSDHLPVVVQLQ